MNVMFVMGGKLVTPLVSDTILDGITRRSVVDIAKDWGMQVECRKVEVAEVINALKNNTLTEAFGAGTAATIAPISNIAFGNDNYMIPPSNQNHFHVKVLNYLADYKLGRVEDKFNWLLKI